MPLSFGIRGQKFGYRNGINDEKIPCYDPEIASGHWGREGEAGCTAGTSF